MCEKKPFFSIVIANYNGGDFLEEAIKSILRQNCDDYEIIIVDGGSTDNSIGIIERYSPRLGWWCSEKDSGQSNAFNKGFRKANGRFFTWLNADDILLPGSLAEVKRCLCAHPWAHWATGNFLRFRNGDGMILEAAWGPHWLPRFLQGNGKINPIFGPTTFWSRDIWNDIGILNEDFHYAMDIEYWARIVAAGYRQVRVNYYCWAFRMHIGSKTAEFDDHKVADSTRMALNHEKNIIRKNYGFYSNRFFRVVGICIRILDGSMLRALCNKFLIRNINDVL